ARTCSLILMVLDVMKPLKHKQLLEYELEGFGIRLNKQPPNIGFKKKDKGGINLTQLVPQSELDLEAVKSILAEYKIHNADITLRYDATSEDLIDVIEGNRVYIPCIYVLNKIDQISIEELDIIYRIPHCVPISAHHKWNFDDLLEKMWQYLNLIRIYTKPKGQLPDYSAPIVLNAEKNTVDDLCLKIHKSLQKDFKKGRDSRTFPRKSTHGGTRLIDFKNGFYRMNGMNDHKVTGEGPIMISSSIDLILLPTRTAIGWFEPRTNKKFWRKFSQNGQPFGPLLVMHTMKQ
ncbi:TGS domain protein, partial [Teladorsagia circumcincta]